MTKRNIQNMNFLVGTALLLTLFPHHGKLPEKPAGVRTAIELVAKRVSLPARTSVNQA